MVMSTRLDTCMEALRSLARSSELEANRLPTAELRIRDFLTPVGTNRGAQRAALEELDNAVKPTSAEGHKRLISPLIDHLVGAREQGRRRFETVRLRGFEVDNELDLRDLLHRQ